MNRLARETSPYLRQHAENPVDWYPWGAEALGRARTEGRPILLSIGYAACHWCHVMAHESFEDPETAALMNELFVNIKVDREERPDLDAIYMGAVQAMTGHGGWPMTVFLTPDGVPFYGGTYYPPTDRQGMPSFRRVLSSVATAFRERRGDVEAAAGQVRTMYARMAAAQGPSGAPTIALLAAAARGVARRFDERSGGFEGAPKFPHAMALEFALVAWRRGLLPNGMIVARDSFLAMSRGGIHDQIGGGFHRYSVDARWQVPHFEKMLYDNALLCRLGVHLFQVTRDPEIREVVDDLIAWVGAEMTAPGGGFYSSLDADSEGEEGRYYVWDAAELESLLGEDARAAAAHWGVTRSGNFEGRNILHVAADADATIARVGGGLTRDELHGLVRRARAALGAARARRPRPARDEKILASWNGLMLRALAEAARSLEHDEARALAMRTGTFLLRELVHDGRATRVWDGSGGTRYVPGFLDDQAALALAALAMYELTFDESWVAHARQMAESMLRWFWDEHTGMFYDTAHDHEALITRPRETTDNATPSGTSLAVELLLRLGDLLDVPSWRQRALDVLSSMSNAVERYPLAFGHLLTAADVAVYGPVEVALLGDPSSVGFVALQRVAAQQYVPGLVLAGGRANGGIALLRDRKPINDAATAFVCRHYACDAPTTIPETLSAQLELAVDAPPADVAAHAPNS
ncbi:MAG TPA: thioredoxin domain-containing protein [Gemmatimonadaceae bacterium]|nr:thioredoxin domain-containing protein [Gemmatimonadaceae bacterium]